jgi:hypothetical protein
MVQGLACLADRQPASFKCRRALLLAVMAVTDVCALPPTGAIGALGGSAAADGSGAAGGAPQGGQQGPQRRGHDRPLYKPPEAQPQGAPAAGQAPGAPGGGPVAAGGSQGGAGQRPPGENEHDTSKLPLANLCHMVMANGARHLTTCRLVIQV